MRPFFGAAWAVLLATVWAASPAAAEEVWILKTGPEAVASIPLDPVQPVDAWRACYTDASETFWIYLTRSPHFFPPKDPGILVLADTGWTVAAFFPASWSGEQKAAWFRLWAVSFRTLASLPSPGWPVVLPSVLRKG